MKKYVDVEELANSLLIDPFECPGCPEPEELEDVLDWLDAAPAADVIELGVDYPLDDFEIVEKQIYPETGGEPESVFCVKRRYEDSWWRMMS